MQPSENVVATGERLSRRMDEPSGVIPVGMELTQIYNQPIEVDKSVRGFVVSVGQAVAIVIIVLIDEIDEIDQQIEEGKEGFSAILDATVSRPRPVMLAAATTVLGLMPLLHFIAHALPDIPPMEPARIPGL